MINCKDWDSFDPQPLTDSKTGQCIGILMPRATQAELGSNIQRWSRPVVETRKHSYGRAR